MVERIKGNENQGLKWLFAFDSCLKLDCLDKLEKRLKSIPNGWRDARMIQTVLGRLIDNLAETIPPRTADFHSEKPDESGNQDRHISRRKRTGLHPGSAQIGLYPFAGCHG